MPRLHGRTRYPGTQRTRLVAPRLAPATRRPGMSGNGLHLADRLSWQDSRRQADADRDILLWKWQGMPKDELIGWLDELTEAAGRLPEIMESIASSIQVMINGVFVEYVPPSGDARATAMRVPDDAPPPVVIGDPPRVHDWNGRQVVFWGRGNGSARTSDDAPLPIAEPFNSTAFDIARGPGYWERTYGGALAGDGPGGRIYAPYDPGVSWPDEGYPCQLCWAAGRWPWEPARVCPLTVPVESTYCVRHSAPNVTSRR
jgi:hypothetical protein